MNTAYRDATFTDVNVLAVMNEQLIRDEKHRFSRTLDELRERMSGWLAGEYDAVIVSIDGEDVGYALFRREADWIYLRQFFVQPSHRRSGIGRAAIEWLRKNRWQDAPRVRLEVLVDNARGIAFWRSVGFEDYCLTMELERGSE